MDLNQMLFLIEAKNFSHDYLHNTFGPASDPIPDGLPSYLFSRGTFSSLNSYATANTSSIAAVAVWHFLQTFLATFPSFNPGVQPGLNDTLPTKVNLFTESYGGIMGPVFANYFEQQNLRRAAGLISTVKALEIHLDSLGIINGLIDQKIAMPFYPRFANNNTYGVQAIDPTTMFNDLSDLQVLGGCYDQITSCRTAMNLSDPNESGATQSINDACSRAQYNCTVIQNSYLRSGLSIYDIRQQAPSPFPSNAYVEYLNTPEVQKAIGARVNYTDSSDAVFNAFLSTGDAITGQPLPDLASLLRLNVRVALIYGDADYICNWLGGEAFANALAMSVDSYATGYPLAGYAQVVINSSYVGGATRQFGNLSFVRVYDSGHQVPAYQPETAFTIFTRVIQGTSVATGEQVDLSSFRSAGPMQSSKTNKAPPSLSPICWVRTANTTCSTSQVSDMLAGKGIVLNGVWYAKESDYQKPSSNVLAGKPGQPIPSGSSASSSIKGSSTVAATGVYTATSTPSPTSGAHIVMKPDVLIGVLVPMILMMLYSECH
jgi:carboxypeptidase C (cathepsin A)